MSRTHNIHAQMLAETALHVGRMWFQQDDNHLFYDYFGMVTEKERYDFLIGLCVTLEEEVEKAGGWEAIETHFVWHDLIDEILDSLISNFKSYKTLEELVNDLPNRIQYIIAKR